MNIYGSFINLGIFLVNFEQVRLTARMQQRLLRRLRKARHGKLLFTNTSSSRLRSEQNEMRKNEMRDSK